MISRAIVILWTLFCAWGLFAGFAELAKEPQLLGSTAGQFGAIIGVLIWLFLWALVVVPVGIIGLLFKTKEPDQATRPKSFAARPNPAKLPRPATQAELAERRRPGWLASPPHLPPW